MKRLYLSLTLLSSVVGLNAAAQTNPWNGSWKADPASMKFSGGTMTIATDASGYTVTSSDGKQLTKVRCDGTPERDESSGTMRSCTKTANGYEVTQTADGKVVRKSTVTAEGKTMTIVRNVTPPSGDPYTMTIKHERVGSGKGVAGTWKEVGFTESQDTGILSIQVDADNIAFKETDMPAPLNLKLDGTDVQQPGGTASARLADDHTLKITYKDAKGTVRRENTFVLSSDGNTITETDVTPTPPSTMQLTLHKS